MQLALSPHHSAPGYSPGPIDHIPLERVIIDTPLRLISMEGAPPIERPVHTPTDRNRVNFLGGLIVGKGRDTDLHAYAASAWSMWGKLWPKVLSGYPVSYTRPGLSGSVTASADDLVRALAILMRAGFLVTDTIDIFGGVARSALRVSPKGRHFILGEEGPAAKIYWPGNDKSGVTLGPGYDMGSKSPEKIEGDLVSVGVSDMVAAATARGFGLRGQNARDFVKINSDVITLTPSQQTGLFARVVPKYESLVVRSLPASLPSRLFQHEFDALLSLAWNTSRFGHYGCNRSISRLDFVTAQVEWRTLIAGGAGILGRRMRETDMFTNARYNPKSMGKSWDLQLLGDDACSIQSEQN